MWVYEGDSEVDDVSESMENGVWCKRGSYVGRSGSFLLDLVMELLVQNVWSEQDWREEMIQDMFRIKEEIRGDAEEMGW